MRTDHSRPGLPGLIGIISLLLITANAHAGWEHDHWAEVFAPTGRADDVVSAPSGSGGLLVIVHDPADEAFNILVQKLDQTGNELWGDQGTVMPYDLASEGTRGPVDVVGDGAGGAYCIYREIYAGQSYLKLARVNDAGQLQWAQVMASFGPNPQLDARLVPAGGSDLYLVWTRSSGLLDQEIIALRVAADGSPLQETTIWEDANGDLDEIRWVVEPDGSGGLLFGIHFNPFNGLFEGRAQRLDAGGNLLWGARGSEPFPALGNVVGVVPDGAGGGYVVNKRGWGETWVQHLDATGAETWPAGGIQPLGTFSTWPNPSEPAFCGDGAGGFFMADGVTDLFAQHLDVFGNRLWGAGGLQITTLAGWQQDATLAPDGFGGVLVAYCDHFFSEVSDIRCRALSAIRLDGFGNTLWENTGFWWTVAEGLSGTAVYYPRVHADGSGGALVAWQQYNDTYTADEVYAAGVGANGNSPALPTLAYIDPDAGAVGDLPAVHILGDYLDAGLEFSLARGGAADATLTGVSALNAQVVTGQLDLAGAQPGAHDLRASRGGGVVATLPDAFGVGDAVPCDDEEVIADAFGPILAPGGKRRMAFASGGDLFTVWIETLASSWMTVWNQREPSGLGWTATGLSSSRPLRDIAIAVGPDDTRHVVFVVEQAGYDQLQYQYLRPDGATGGHLVDMPTTIHHPAIASDAPGEAHIVCEADGGGTTALMYVRVTDATVDAPVDIGAGVGAAQPDLTVDGSGLTLAYVRDFWFPGLHEMCYQRFNGGTWEVPVGVYFGVQVTSPAVAWDGADRLLFSWVLDNTGSDPLLHTMTMDHQVAGPVRWRLGLPLVYDSTVVAAGPERFFLATRETVTGTPMQIILREGDGNVFFPRKRINAGDDVEPAVLAARPGLDAVAATWIDYATPLHRQRRFFCSTAPSPAPLPTALRALAAGPNPFNPETTFRFDQRAAGWTRLAVFDVRGRVVRTLADGNRAAGGHAIRWDGRDDHGRNLPSGVYFGRVWLPAGQEGSVVKVTLLK
ncbi:hypothetical protein KDM41_03880 [bacterium]|nr:hypothetical protein [bacterium]